jgi:8-oxo-dGTP pyrophosphatase MutT (NUDIX family)
MFMKSMIFKFAQRFVLQPFARQARGLTLGTRTVVFDAQQRVLLVRHSYAPGWLFPGGGVDRGETLTQSAIREIDEEAGVVAKGQLLLHGMFSNESQFKGDHVACYVLREFERKNWQPNLEIREAAFFPLNDLPDGTTGGTKRRLDEILHGKPPAAHW